MASCRCFGSDIHTTKTPYRILFVVEYMIINVENIYVNTGLTTNKSLNKYISYLLRLSAFLHEVGRRAICISIDLLLFNFFSMVFPIG
jgi:hypothetical protein